MLRKLTSLLLIFAMLSSFTSCAMFRPEEARPGLDKTEEIYTDPVTEGPVTTEPVQTEPSTDTPETDEYITHPERIPGDPLTVCIDPGHGYVDPGSTSDYLNGKWEREIVREYAELLAEKLEGEGCRVIILWDPDEYITAAEIASAAKKAGVPFIEEKLVDDRRFAAYNRSVWANVLHRETYIDVFVSLHVNTYTADENVWGTRVYYCNETDYASASATLCKNLTAGIGSMLPDQKTRYYADSASDAFIVTKVPETASALIEIGFVTNHDEANNILETEWMGKFVEGIKSGIVAYGGNI